MGWDFDTTLYVHCFNTFARPITITPVTSQPGQPAYSAAGIHRTYGVEVLIEDGTTVEEQRHELDLQDHLFGIVPQQGDLIHIPVDTEGPDLGDFEVISSANNGVGHTTLIIRAYGPAAP